MGEPTKLIYGNSQHIIKKSCYKNFDYLIIKNVMGPCAYVVLKQKPNWDVFELYKPHGGITYYEQGLEFYSNDNQILKLVSDDYSVVGWDFMHADDYLASPYTNKSSPLGILLSNGLVWSLSMIEKNIFDTIDEIINRN